LTADKDYLGCLTIYRYKCVSLSDTNSTALSDPKLGDIILSFIHIIYTKNNIKKASKIIVNVKNIFKH
jgi:hypothetical protein